MHKAQLYSQTGKMRSRPFSFGEIIYHVLGIIAFIQSKIILRIFSWDNEGVIWMLKILAALEWSARKRGLFP